MMYNAVIYQCTQGKASWFEIEIYKGLPNHDPIRSVVFMRGDAVDRVIDIRTLCKYMVWKFKHCQRIINGRKPICNLGTFTNVVGDINYIKAVINAEFDFHLYDRTTGDMGQYLSSQYTTPQLTNKFKLKDPNHPLNRPSRGRV